MNNNIKLAIIDVDGMFYQAATDTIEASIQKFKEKFNNLLEQTKATHYVGFYSNGRYFRHQIDSEYKSQRGKYDPPKWLKALKNWAITEYGFQYMDMCEADDLACYWMNNFGSCIETPDGIKIIKKDILNYVLSNPQYVPGDDIIPTNIILCTPDKDLLQSIPGKHFNYTYKLKDDIKKLVKSDVMYQIKDEDIIKGWWVETKVNESMNFKFMQLIVGDSSDGIKSVEGKGIKFFESRNDWDLCNILEEYLKKYGQSKGIYEFQKNYRLLHMLENDEDFMREVGKLPEFPIITEVKKESNNIEF